jgi:hypothetical protein
MLRAVRPAGPALRLALHIARAASARRQQRLRHQHGTLLQ